MNDQILLYISLILFGGLLVGRFVKLFNLPNVTGYLIAGLILGPSLANFIPADMVRNFSLVSDMTLGFIAFSIGSEFKFSYFKEVGTTPVIVAIMEACGAMLLVTLTLLLFGTDLRLALLFGAIASATAPAQTLMVVQQYRARGPMTSLLMSVVALDDAVALIAFGFATTIVNSMNHPGTNMLFSIAEPFIELVISLVVGAALAFVMMIFLRYFKKPSNRISILLAFIFLIIYLADRLHGSPLLACMAMGTVLVNWLDDIEDLTRVAQGVTPPLFVIFFVISGAGLDFKALSGIGVVGIIYIVVRVLGKHFGAWFGATITRSEQKIRTYLGLTLMPQAGVALGLVIVAAKAVPEYAAQINVVILSSTFIYSLIGPSAAKYALVKAGEIKMPGKSSPTS
ncbi:MAG: cation:proton antiporter [Eubacteriales bacterium]|nr:cation:proton antiporter [Eubacteriales bacterium]